MSRGPRARARAAAEAEARHREATAPTSRWSWTAALLVAALLTLLSALPSPASGSSMWAVYGAAAATATYWLVLLTARLALSRRSAREAVSLLRSEVALRGWMVSLIVPVGGVALMLGVGLGVGGDRGLGLALVAVVVATMRALSIAYRDQYLHVVLTPEASERESRLVADRSRWERITNAIRPRSLREFGGDLPAPLLQAATVLGSAALLWIPLAYPLLSWIGPSWYNDSTTQIELGRALPTAAPLVVLTVFAWARWHLFGGTLAVIRASRRRALDPARRPSATPR